MKKYLIGMLTTLLINFTANVCWYEGIDHNNDRLTAIGQGLKNVIAGEAIIHVATKRCTNILIKDKSQGDSESVKARDYFECNITQKWISDLIFGE